MPICNASMTSNNKSSVAIDDHASEAAKMKRTREQAYFNSYDFDAIEVLPYDDDEEDDKLQSQLSNVNKQAASFNRGLHAVQSGLIGKYRGIGYMTTRQSQRQRRRLNNGSLSSKSSSNIASSSSSTRSGSSFSGSQPISRSNYPYLHSLGTLLAGTKSKIVDGENHITELDAEFGNVKTPKAKLKAIDVNSLNKMENGSFSLPRANLKYQSMNDTLTVVSMPAGVSTKIISPPTSLNGTMNDKNLVLMPFNRNGGSQAHILHMDDGQMTSLQMLSKSSSVANNSNSSVLRIKKPSSTSTTTSISTLAAVDNGCANAVVETSEAPTAELMKNISRNSMATTAPTTKSAAISMQKSKRAGSSGGSSAESEKATSWQQSHYSTNKSGSSGYYSSNVCSTYSLEDHIYCEPVVNGDVLDISNKQTKSKSEQLKRQIRNRTNATIAADVAIGIDGSGIDSELLNSKQLMTNSRLEIGIGADDKDGVNAVNNNVANTQVNLGGMSFNENLRILETSIENLDRHLRNIPSLNTQESVVAFVHTHAPSILNQDVNEKKHLPTIMEGPTSQPRSWPDDIADDSLMDIDLDSFLLNNDPRKRVNKHINASTHSIVGNGGEGIVNPSFLSDEQEENHYKCAKYINSCPEDAYRVESDIVTVSETSDVRDQFLKRYENQLHFESTRDLLEDVRDKIRLLSQSNSHAGESTLPAADMIENGEEDDASAMPKELEAMIKALKRELETYLARMNQHSEREIRQLCTGIVKNQKVVRMTKAFERRRSEFDILRGFNNGAFTPVSGVPMSIRQQITSIRCASDPNFKMKRKSLADVFPVMANTCYTDSQKSQQQQQQQPQQNGAQLQWQSQYKLKSTNEQLQPQQRQQPQRTQLQRNLSFHQPMLLNNLNSKANISNRLNINSTTTDIRNGNGTDNVGNINGKAGGTAGSGSAGGSDTGEQTGDKESIMEWHRKKPSIWEMYYGTNRLNQKLLADQRNVRQQLAANNSQPTTMSYPSSRPESDFTLDLPRAEQLRIKMEKEKKFRKRCRYITAFLSLMFFLLTVIVVSMVLTRGKRMFGSMI